MNSPRVVIGLPVFNGENFLVPAIQSILGQTYTDLRLIISDNASEDGTEEICRRYAQQDSRIVYHRQETNIGAAPNYNFVFQPGDAPYFKWAAHDDTIEPDYIKQSVAILDQDPTIAIAHCPSFETDGKGNKVGTYDHNLRLDGATAKERFWKLIWTIHFTEVFGLMRSEFVANTKLHGSYVGSDRNFMAEMLLQGNVGYGEERLFCRRQHGGSYMDVCKDDTTRLQWFDPKAKYPASLMSMVKFREYFDGIFRQSIPLNEKLACVGILVEWVGRRGIESITGNYDSYRKKIEAEYQKKTETEYKFSSQQ